MSKFAKHLPVDLDQTGRIDGEPEALEGRARGNAGVHLQPLMTSVRGLVQDGGDQRASRPRGRRRRDGRRAMSSTPSSVKSLKPTTSPVQAGDVGVRRRAAPPRLVGDGGAHARTRSGV